MLCRTPSDVAMLARFWRSAVICASMASFTDTGGVMSLIS